MLKKLRAMTLLELLVSVGLVALIVIAFASIQRFSVFNVRAADVRARLQNEGSYVLEHMTKNIVQGIGDVMNPAITPAGDPFIQIDTLMVRIDNSTPATPGNYSDDVYRTYTFRHNGVVEYCLNANQADSSCISGLENISSKVDGNFIIYKGGNRVDISLTARDNPSIPVSIDNPEVAMNSTVFARSASEN